MRLSRWSGAICAALIATQVHAGQEVGDYRGLPQDLAAAATAYDLAQFKSDRAELERLLADDYVLANANGENQTKAQDIADAVAPGSKTTYVAITQQVRKVWPNGAVLGGMVDAKGFNRGKAFTMRARFVDVWAKRDGRWQVIFTQVNSAP
ncbi:nuclear transport factor 2 family protein [Dyella sp. 2HG41-7]|uniref:nuclear transport factor 2 family protein n=1 Tax=Dyella sp. 2HG41-7 TaxID=2883239 RepID=UPI001F1837BF|nr:nuclear transport factor 2 family protein [Dyella sp. 2HG41-7]